MYEASDLASDLGYLNQFPGTNIKSPLFHLESLGSDQEKKQPVRETNCMAPDLTIYMALICMALRLRFLARAGMLKPLMTSR